VIMVRRPMLEPNLNASGLAFTAASLLVFLLANVVTGHLAESDKIGPRRAEAIREGEEHPEQARDLAQHGPGYPLFYLLASYANEPFFDRDQPEAVRKEAIETATARTTAIIGHLAVVIGIVLIGYRHFDNFQTGVAAATLYLLMPYTAQWTNRVDHVVPAALLVWAVQSYRRPVVSGILIGLAAGVIYYPLFLLPLWCSFYWRRGLARFLIGSIGAMIVLVASLALTSTDWANFVGQLRLMFGWTALVPQETIGFWHYHELALRVPVMAAFVIMCASLALWPAQKNLGTLLSCTAAVMLGVQFWHAQEGGIYMAWYLPLLILTIFRPNLEDRVALSAVSDIQLRWRKKAAAGVSAAVAIAA
ncbi:MAG: hypothetical protein ACOY3P_01035, partial [Planctomycetota bacterium]